MMQNVATLKTDLATTALPFDGINNTVSTPPKNDAKAFDQSFSQRNAFEDAMNRAKQSAHARDEQVMRNDVVRDRQEEQQSRRIEAREDMQRSTARAQEEAAQRAEEKSTQPAVDSKAKKSNVDDTLETKTSGAEHISDGKASAPAQDPSSLKQTEASSISDNGHLKNIKNHEFIEQSDTKIVSDEDFDWVEYVNLVRLASDESGTDLAIKAADTDTIPNDLFSQFIKDQQAVIDSSNQQRTLDKETNQAFLTVSLSQEDISAVLAAQGLNIENNLVVDPDKLAALDKAVTNILQQFIDAGESKDTVSPAPSEAQNKLDNELLKSMFSATNKDATDANTSPFKADAADQPTANIKNDLFVGPSVTEGLDTAVPAEFDASLQKAPQKAQPDILTASVAADSEASDGINAALKNAPATTPNTAAIVDNVTQGGDGDKALSVAQAVNKELAIQPQLSPVEAKSTAINLDVPKNTSAKKGVEILAKLPDETLNIALENINKRVAEIVPDVKTELKGSEFIAALQAGVKEVKEQMKQGREPGIDLKQLVADAMVKSDTAGVSPQQDVKIDKQITQLTNLLGAATSITQSSTQIVNASLGLGEVTLQKELNQAQIENAKSLNQTPANNDKAMNILKPDGQTQLTEKVRWMVNNRSLTAEIRLDPPDLGGMQIKVAMSGDAATVNFTVQSQQARDALDQAAPQLREMLEERGIQLGESNVQQDSSQQGQQFAENGNSGTSSANMSDSKLADSQNTDSDTVDESMTQRIVNGRIGGIDSYA